MKRVRERLGLRYRDVEQASISIAQRYGNDEFIVALSRLSDIENKGTVPSMYRLYSLCAIYRLDFVETLSWFGVKLAELAADSALVPLESTHPIGFAAEDYAHAQTPIALDPGIDLRRTTFLSRLIQRWGTLPLLLLNRMDPKSHHYAYIGTEDWSMYPILAPGSLVMVDTAKRDLTPGSWASEHERPIFLLEHRDGFLCGWCSLDEQRSQLIVQSHPASGRNPALFRYPNEIEVTGQVVAVAMRLAPSPKRRTRS
ncbi:MAG: hypothetical protein R2729_12165 [Bryobacteraceae bacterium]